MRHNLLLALVAFALIVAACGGGNAPAPAATSDVSATEAPAATDAPTDAPEPTVDSAATASAEAAAAAAAQAATASEDIKAELEDAGYTPGDGSVGWVQGDAIAIVINEQNFGGTFDDLGIDTTFSNFALSVDVNWETVTGISGCGMIFYAESLESGGGGDNTDPFIQFYTGRLSGAPFWGFELWKFGAYSASLGSGYNSAIKDGQGSTNHYLLVVRNSEARIFANGTRAGYSSLPASTTEGQIGFMGWQDSGVTTCTFTNGVVWNFPSN